MNDWHKLHITDKTGKEFFKTNASPMSTISEIKNLQKHLNLIRTVKNYCPVIDSETAVLMLDGSQYGN